MYDYNDPMPSIAFSNHPIFANDEHATAPSIDTNLKSPLADGQRSTKIGERKTLIKRKLSTALHKKQRQPKILRVVNGSIVTTNETYSDTIHFGNWLSSIVERINLTMDFNGNGTPDKLIFSVPNVGKCFFFLITMKIE